MRTDVYEKNRKTKQCKAQLDNLAISHQWRGETAPDRMSSQLSFDPSLRASSISSNSVFDIVHVSRVPVPVVVKRVNESVEWDRNEYMSSSSEPENVNVSENGEVGCDGAESE